jgi:hypothetical protein
MDLTPHLDAIRADLGSVLGANEDLEQAMERMARPLEASLQLRLLDLLGDGALELTEQLPQGHAEVRVSGKDASLVFVGVPEPPAPPVPPPAPDDEGGTARLTLRMPDAMKVAVEDAADTLGMSVNAWLVRAVQVALGRAHEQRARAATNRISGFARS